MLRTDFYKASHAKHAPGRTDGDLDWAALNASKATIERLPTMLKLPPACAQST